MSAPLISFGQNNEDVVLWRCFRDQPGGFYIDVGAGDPVVDSVTKVFYDSGWSGINAEPQVPLYMALCDQRPRDVTLNVAFGDRHGLLELHTAVDYWGLTTTDATIAAQHGADGVRIASRLVPVVPLNSVLDAVKPSRIDFLKIDVEGAELSVLRGMDFERWRPRVVVIEAALPVFLGPGVVPPAIPARNEHEWEYVMLDAGYVRALFDGVNMFYVDAADEYLGEVLQAPANVLDNFIPFRFAQPLGYVTTRSAPSIAPAPAPPAAAPSPAPLAPPVVQPVAGPQAAGEAPGLIHVSSMSTMSWQQVLRGYVNAFGAADHIELVLWMPSDRCGEMHTVLAEVNEFVTNNVRSTDLPRFEIVTDAWSESLLRAALTPSTTVVAPNATLAGLIGGASTIAKADKASMRSIVDGAVPTPVAAAEAVRTPVAPPRVDLTGPAIELRHGVNIIGYFNAETGEGEVARQLSYGMEAAEIPYRIVSLREGGKPNQRAFTFGGETDVLFGVNIIVAAPHVLPTLHQTGLAEVMSGRYNIGVWPWEVEILPGAIADAGAALLDEIWGISEHASRAIDHAVDTPVFTYAPTIWPLPRVPEIERPEGWLTTFLYCFSFHSVTARKNPLGLVEAYKLAFPEPCGTRLVLKSMGGDAHLEELEAVKAAVGDRPDIVVADGYLSVEEQEELLDWCDAYVSLHRAEGYGFTMSEAMVRSKPVIATGYSGNVDFMTDDTALLVPYSLVLVGAGSEPYPAEARWAEPDISAAAEAMWWVFNHPEEASEIGERARDHIGTDHVPSARREFLRSRVEAAYGAVRTA
ncbi:MAG: FkbM family methyltransferase [Acidimicrobiia bacterium]